MHLYDPLDFHTLVDPYPLYVELRERSPIFWHDAMQSWVLTRYRDCRDVLKNYQDYARDRRRIGEDIPEFRQSLQSLDPPHQAPLRSLLVNSFRNQNPVEIARRTQGKIRFLLDQLMQRDTFDWMRDVAAPVALGITSELVGVTEPDGDRYARISEGIAYRMDAGLVPERAIVGDQARHQLNELVENWLGTEERPGVLADVRRDAEKAQVPEYYIRNTTGMMFNASYGTIYATAGNVVLTLLRNPQLLETIRENENILPTAVDELIRYDGPAQGTSRVTVRRMVIDDTVIEPGDIVLTLLAAANRDPDQFPDPERIVLNRKPNQHLSFGWGPHACLGALFGRAAIQELIVGLLRSPQQLRLAGTPTRRPTATVRTIGVLPVTFHAEFATEPAHHTPHSGNAQPVEWRWGSIQQERRQRHEL
jgi:cytochrome P450